MNVSSMKPIMFVNFDREQFCKELKCGQAVCSEQSRLLSSFTTCPRNATESLIQLHGSFSSASVSSPFLLYHQFHNMFLNSIFLSNVNIIVHCCSKVSVRVIFFYSIVILGKLTA